MRRHLPVALVILVGVALSAVFFSVARGWEQDRLEAKFARRTANITQSLQQGINHCIEVLESIGALFDSSEEIPRQFFREFAGEAVERHPMIQALEWIPRVKASERALYEEAARREGLPGFQITERKSQGTMVREARRQEYYPVYYVQPLAGNESAIGYDLASDPARLETLERARDSGRMVATSWITLVQEHEGEFGFLVYRPVYRKNAPHGTPEERKENLVGFALAVYRVGDLVEGWLKGVNKEGIGFRLYDETAQPRERFVYHHHGLPAWEAGPEQARQETGETAGLQRRATLNLPGRRWTLLLHPLPEFLGAEGTSQAGIILVSGLMITGLLGAYLFRTLSYSDKLEREVAERKLVEDQLRKLSDVVLQSPCTVTITDTDGTIEYVNPKFTEATGYGPEEAVGKNARILKSGEQPRELYEELWDTITSGGKWLGEFHNRKKNGELYWELASISPIRDRDGEITHYVKVAEIITDRKEAEEELVRTNERLTQAYEALERAQVSAIASAKMAALGRLTAGATHEILNPLNGITIALHMLINDPDTPPGIVEGLEGSMEQAKRIAKIVDNLLYFSQQREPKRNPLDLNTTVQRCLSLFKTIIKHQNIAVEKDLEEGLPKIMADQEQIQQVVLNLLTNALDEMPSGGNLSVRTKEVRLEDRRHLELRIEDTGKGIAPEDMDKLFEPFFTKKTVGKGTGLGLSICQGIVEAHGGSISAENLPEGGAAFVVRLPMGG